MLWFYRGMNDLGIFFEGNRPFLKIVYQPFFFLFGSNALAWAFFGVLTRWLTAMGFYGLFQAIWPKNKILAVANSLGMVVYPGFQAQFSSMIFGISFFIYALFIFSLYFSIKFIQNSAKKYFWLGLSLLFSALSLFTSEYFFTLEIIRYFLIWIIVSRVHKGNSLKVSFQKSIPYLSLYALAIIWRLFQQSSETTYSFKFLDNLKAAFFPTIINQAGGALADIWYTSIKVWLNSFSPSHLLSSQGPRVILFYYALMLCLFLFVVFFLIKISNSNAVNENHEYKSAILIGLFALFFAGIPFWMAGLPLTDKYFFTRWTIPFMFGSCLLMPALIFLLFNEKLASLVIISILVALGAGTQFLSANSFRHDWEKQHQFYWNLIWRIPSLKENTTLFSDMMNFNYENSDQLSSGINFAFSDNGIVNQIPYFLFYLPERIKTSILPEIASGISLSGKRYYASFEGNTSQALLIEYSPPACLHILNPVLDKDNPSLSGLMKSALFLSRLELISPSVQDQPNQKPIDIIGKEPQQNWCYYFEKADLANQFGDWQLVENLYLEAENNNFSPRDGREWLPFIESLAHQSNWSEAARLTKNSIALTPGSQKMLCRLWGIIDFETPGSSQKKETLVEIFKVLNCK
jgi:hypothetical protein